MPSEDTFPNLKAEEVQKIFRILQFSPMPRKEKILWIKLLPYMSNDQVSKFISILETENGKITDLALNLLEKKSLEKKI